MVRRYAASLVREFEVPEAFYKRNYPKGLGFVGRKVLNSWLVREFEVPEALGKNNYPKGLEFVGRKPIIRVINRRIWVRAI